MVGIGFFDQQGNACLKFHLCGVNHDEPGLEFSGIIDTGFTGFLQVPIQHAFSLGLPLNGTVSATLADASQVTCLTALGRTTFAKQTLVGVVMLEFQSQDILIGMDFLRQFKASLVIAKGHVVLFDEDWIEKALSANSSHQAAPGPSQPGAPAGNGAADSDAAAATPSVAGGPGDEPEPSAT